MKEEKQKDSQNKKAIEQLVEKLGAPGEAAQQKDFQMNNKKMLLFSDYVRDKEALEHDINKLLYDFVDTYQVTIEGADINLVPSFGDKVEYPDSVNIKIR